eukprot:400392_1
MEDDWLMKQRAKQSKIPPLKSQKSSLLLQKMIELNKNQNDINDEKSWRAKLQERNKKNMYKNKPKQIDTKIENNTNNTNNLTPKPNNTNNNSNNNSNNNKIGHKRQKSASQQ